MDKYVVSKAFLDKYGVPTKSLKKYHEPSSESRPFTREQVYELIDIICVHTSVQDFVFEELELRLDEVFK